MAITSIHITKDIAEKVRTIVQKQNPLRNITTNAMAIRDVLIDFINKNKKYLQENNSQNTEPILKEPI